MSDVRSCQGFYSQHAQLTLDGQQPEHRVQQRRLSCPIGAHEANDASWRNVDVYRIERHVIAEPPGHAAGRHGLHELSVRARAGPS
jgi:hypothetical protein